MRIGKYTIIKTSDLETLQRRNLKLIELHRWFSGWKDLDIIWDYVFEKTYYGSIETCRKYYANSRKTDIYGQQNETGRE